MQAIIFETDYGKGKTKAEQLGSHDKSSKTCGLVVKCFSLVMMLGALVLLLAHSNKVQN